MYRILIFVVHTTELHVGPVWSLAVVYRTVKNDKYSKHSYIMECREANVVLRFPANCVIQFWNSCRPNWWMW